jgi:NAD-dependent deacetylase
MNRLDEAAEKILAALGREGRLTVLTGAGISAESGLATFRDRGGIWQRYSLEDVATPEAFARNPRLVLEFYDARRRQLREAAPNPAHFALARLEELLQSRFTLITQNIDDLHERAGSRRVLHMHGALLEARCARCSAVLAWQADITLDDRCAQCSGQLRPNVVWFGEVPFHLEDEIPRALEAEVFLSAGTSGTVYPAAGFVATAKLAGRLTLEVNLEPSENAWLFDLQIAGRAGERLPALVQALERLGLGR